MRYFGAQSKRTKMPWSWALPPWKPDGIIFVILTKSFAPAWLRRERQRYFSLGNPNLERRVFIKCDIAGYRALFAACWPRISESAWGFGGRNHSGCAPLILDAMPFGYHAGRRSLGAAGMVPLVGWLFHWISRDKRKLKRDVPEVTRQQKITFGEMRSSGVRGLLIYCSD
jgi:hypothetical protein